MRYIDADKLIADLEHDIAIDTDMILYPGTDNMHASLYQSDKDIKQNCIDILIKTTTADVVEVVRCKDCKHYLPNLTMMGCNKGLDNVRMNDYCSYGERAGMR